MTKPPWGHVPAKIGSVPMVVIFDKRYSFEEGKKIRYRRCECGSKWGFGIVKSVDPIMIIKM